MLNVSAPDAPQPATEAASTPEGGRPAAGGGTERLARQANALISDLMRPSAAIYWLDLTLTSLATWASLLLAADAASPVVRLGAGLVCVFALYRAVSFIHELAHVRPGDLPGFRLAWNVLIGVPFLAPSFFYEGVHVLHHAKDRYGTVRDPEYLPLSRYPPAMIAAFVAVAALAPLGLIIRFGIATPLSLLSPAIRRPVVAKISAMTINPAFERQDAERAAAAPWLTQEIACWLWTWILAALTATGVMPLRYPLTAIAVLAAATLINQLRTVAAHAWTNDGGKMSFLDQFRDSVNVPPPALLPMLWAPVGLRYHALHHLAPRLPYHNLGEAHRRLAAALPPTSVYHQAARANLADALGRLLASARDHARRSA
jgi:fatty acid desaturase